MGSLWGDKETDRTNVGRVKSKEGNIKKAGDWLIIFLIEIL
jgi:hypothetical protein